MVLSKEEREELKELAVTGAVEWIKNNYDFKEETRIGVGSGSTVEYSFPMLSEIDNIVAVPSSVKTRRGLENLAVKIDELREADRLEFDIDGADEVDPELNLIKGGGGCHYREKKVAKQSKLLIIVVDQTKLVDYLGQTFSLPVEVEPLKKDAAITKLSDYGEPLIRKTDGEPFVTDNENIIIDVKLHDELYGRELELREKELNGIDGVVENGFFARRKADIVFVGTEDGLEVLGDEL